jgi:hypothetical protein
VYAYILRRGYAPEDAEDLTQEFFTRLIEKRHLRNVSSERGSVGCYLFGAVRHFLADERDRARAKKRGGSAIRVAIDDPEAGPDAEPADFRTPAGRYESRRALAVLAQARRRLRREFRGRGQAERFERFEPMLTDWRPSQGYGAAACELGVSRTVIKVGIHRLRHRYGEVLREELSKAARGRDIAGEIRFLIRAVSY